MVDYTFDEFVIFEAVAVVVPIIVNVNVVIDVAVVVVVVNVVIVVVVVVVVVVAVAVIDAQVLRSFPRKERKIDSFKCFRANWFRIKKFENPHLLRDSKSMQS